MRPSKIQRSKEIAIKLSRKLSKVIDKKVPSFDPFATTYLAKDDFQKIFNTENLTPQATHKINEAKTSLVKKLERQSIQLSPQAT